MKKLYICAAFVFMFNIVFAQDSDCYEYASDDKNLRYTASGYQDVINGNHSKAINESRKIANVIAENELAKMIDVSVSCVVESMALDNAGFHDIYVDTMLISTYKIFKGMRTVCQSETKLIGNTYVTYVTKEMSLDNISDLFDFENIDDKDRFRKLLGKINNN